MGNPVCEKGPSRAFTGFGPVSHEEETCMLA
jgi:hypothetical protein